MHKKHKAKKKIGAFLDDDDDDTDKEDER